MTPISEAFEVTSVLPIWNIQTALASPCASSTSLPVSWAELVKQYTPGASVSPPRSWPVSAVWQTFPARRL